MPLLALVSLVTAASLASWTLHDVRAAATADRVAAWLCAWTALGCALMWPQPRLGEWGWRTALQRYEVAAMVGLWIAAWLLSEAERRRDQKEAEKR